MAATIEEIFKESSPAQEVAVSRQSSSNQPATSLPERMISIAIKPEIRSFEMEWLGSLFSGGIPQEEVPVEKTKKKPKIQRVPRIFSQIESNKKCYEPLVVSIGPYHHGKQELQGMEKSKPQAAKQFIDECAQKKGSSRLNTACELYAKVAEMVDHARQFYAADEEDPMKAFDDAQCARMLFLDGCFILEFMDSSVFYKSEKPKMKSHDVTFARRDMFLLENQIPFQVLEMLMSFRYESNEGRKMIDAFIKQTTAEPYLGRLYFRSKQVMLEDLKEKPFHHLLDIVLSQLFEVEDIKGYFRTGGWHSHHSHRSTTQLKSLGIGFKPSKTHLFSDITFKSSLFSSLLTLPPIAIDDSTKSLLLNLVAYEACPDTPNDSGVTSYICFMHSLINQPEDVKELRSKGILLNFLGSDQDVVDLFNEISKDLVPNPIAFENVKLRMQHHFENYLKVWMAEWRNVAFFAAVFAIVLSIIQTLLTVIQTYLAAYPPKK